MTNQETHVTNAAESTLSNTLAQAATTVDVTSTSAFPAVPFYAVIDPKEDAKREVVRATAKTATSLTIVRGEDNTSDVAHDPDVVIAVVPVAALWTDINDRVDAADTALTTHQSAFDTDHGTDHDARDHSGLTGIPVVATARKSAHESVTSSTTLQDDDELVLSIDASSTYAFDLTILADGDSSGDIKLAFTVPTGTSIVWDTGTRGSGSGSIDAAKGSGDTKSVELTASGTTSVILIKGVLETSTTAGSLQLQWAQNISSATATRVLGNSVMRTEKVT